MKFRSNIKKSTACYLDVSAAYSIEISSRTWPFSPDHPVGEHLCGGAPVSPHGTKIRTTL